MKVFDGLRTWWQKKTGEEETPFDGDAPVWVISLMFHLGLMLILAFTNLHDDTPQALLTLEAPLELEEHALELPKEFVFSEQPSDEIGPQSEFGSEMALSEAPIITEVSIVPNPVDMEPSDVSTIRLDNIFQQATGLFKNENVARVGAVGEAATGAEGAVDRITHEITLSLEERKTLVIWLFDQSPSMLPQRASINQRFQRIYEELGVIEAAGNRAFAKHDDKPLLTAVVAFGKNVTLRTPNPTDNIAEIKEAINKIEPDESGIEKTFSAIYMAADKFRGLRMPQPTTRQPERNVMLVVFTDEAGDDQEGMEETVKICRRYGMPVYVVGVPAPFGRRETLLKWVDPDPNYDQTPQWGAVDQGPETFLPERLKLAFSGGREDDEPIDSGFGPFALTRLAYETGGIYFAVHPNRNVNRTVSRAETSDYSAHIRHFFDPQVMRNYRPDYISKDEYLRRVTTNTSREALIRASDMSWVSPMEAPRLRFVKRDEATFATELTEAQRNAARLEPKVEGLYQMLKLGEADRQRETVLRWKAGYDLSMGRVLAVKVRTEAYNAMLAQAKRGLKFKEEKNNTWILEPSDEVSVGSQMQKLAASSREYLERVVQEHPGTPWAMLAQRELDNKLGWTWKEDFTDLAPPRVARAGNNNNAPPPADDRARMLKKPKRAIPKKL